MSMENLQVCSQGEVDATVRLRDELTSKLAATEHGAWPHATVDDYIYLPNRDEMAEKAYQFLCCAPAHDPMSNEYAEAVRQTALALKQAKEDLSIANRERDEYEGWFDELRQRLGVDDMSDEGLMSILEYIIRRHQGEHGRR